MGAILLTLDGRERSIDGFPVRRVLPSVPRRTVGPFTFFDEMGPRVLGPGAGMDVRPHPHIGLSTVTYLFEGEVLHRDSLGTAQLIRPGDVNWMTAGRGIVHSERATRTLGGRLHGLQLWVALPLAEEERAPSFEHHPVSTLPTLTAGEAEVRVLAGSIFGRTAPVTTFSPLGYADVALPRGASIEVPAEHADRAVYVVSGEVELEGARGTAGRLWVLAPGARAELRAVPSGDGDEGARVAIVGGAPLDGPRHIDWNFVSSSKERIEQAKRDWREGRFPKVPGDETEFVPLP